jgi:hypothetical protein
MLVSLAASAPARADLIYKLDDGSGSVNSGPTFVAPEFMWGNVFTSVPGCGQITMISVAFGKIPAGRKMCLYIFQDPTPDHDPRDAAMLLRLAALTDPKGGNTFTDYAIPTTTVTGDFFIAVSTSVDGTSNDLPARLDPQGAPNADRAWFFAADSFASGNLGTAPYQLQLGAFPLPSVVMVRATGVPGPGAGVAAALGTALATRRRRRGA